MTRARGTGWVIIRTNDFTVTGMFPTMIEAEGWAYDTYGNTGWAVRQVASPTPASSASVADAPDQSLNYRSSGATPGGDA